MRLRLEDLEMPQVLQISEELTLLVGFERKSGEMVIAVGRGF